MKSTERTSTGANSARSANWYVVRYFMFPISMVIACEWRYGGLIMCAVMWFAWSANILHETAGIIPLRKSTTELEPKEPKPHE